MARMTQTITDARERPDPDPVRVRPPAPDLSGTRTVPGVRTPKDSDSRPDPINRPDSDPRPDPDPDSDPDYSDPGPGPDGPDGPGPDASPDSTRTRTETRTPADADKIADGPGPDGPGPDNTETRTRTRTESGAEAVRESAGILRAWLANSGYFNVLTVVVAVVASLGQKEFAETKAKFVKLIMIGSFDLTPWLAPVVFDVSVAALLHGGLFWARKRHSPWPWWIAAAGVGGVSVFTNLSHVGWQIAAPASGGLFVIWFLRLYFQYQELRREREVEDDTSDEFRKTDFLFEVAKPLAQTAWLIARTKPLAAGLAYRHRMGDTDLTKRDLAIMLARQYNTIYTDRLYRLTNPHLFAPAAAAPAGSDQDGATKTKPPRKVHWWNRRQLADARRRAAMTAEDQIDRALGLPIVERTGIIIEEVSYAETKHTTLLAQAPALSHPAVAVQQQLPEAPATGTALEVAAPAGPDPVVRTAPPRPRRQAAPAPASRELVVDATEFIEVQAPDGMVYRIDRPRGNGGSNWRPLNEIKGLESFYIDPTLKCRCETKPCGWTLLEHATRRGQQIEAVVNRNSMWAARPDPIGKPDVLAAGIPGSGAQVTIMGIMNQMRTLPSAQSVAEDAVVEDAEEVQAATADAG